MKNKFDKIMADNIKAVFEEKEFDYNPENWNKLKTRLMQDRNKKRFLFIIYGVAASIFIAFGTFFIYKSVNQTDAINNNIISNTDEVREESNRDNLDRKTIFEKDTLKSYKSNDSENIFPTKTKKNNIVRQHYTQTKLSHNVVIDTINNEIIRDKDIPETISNNYLHNTLITQEIEDRDKEAIENLHVDHEVVYYIPEPVKKSSQSSIGVLLSSFMNTTNVPSKSGFNYGAGLAYEREILRNLNINLGVVYSEHSITMSVQEAFNPSNLSTLETIDAEFRTLEIPLNLKYKISENEKRELYVSLGVSSLTHFSENFEYEYNLYEQTTEIENEYVISVPYENAYPHQNADQTVLYYRNVETYKNNTEIEEPGEIYYSRLLNFSGSIKYKLNKKYNVVIEPYIKIPIGKNNVESYKISSGGINLLFNFDLSKKI